MVSRLTPQLKIEIDSYAHKLTLDDFSHVGDNVTIRWGRSSLFESPQNRSCTVTVLSENDDSSPKRFLFAMLRVRLGNEVLFDGHIDRITLGQRIVDGKRQSVLAISAVEAITFHPDMLAHRIFWPPNNVYLWQSFQSHGDNPEEREIVGLDFNNPPEFHPDEARKWSLYEAFSCAAMPYPLSFANWLPGFKKVQTTRWFYGLGEIGEVLSTDFCTVDNVQSTVENNPQLITLGSGGQYGDVGFARARTRIATSRPGVTGVYGDYDHNVVVYPEKEVLQPIATESKLDFEPAFRLVFTQRSDPLRITVIDDTKCPSWEPSRNLFRTWEQLGISWHFAVRKTEKFYYELGGSELLPIGGTLRFTHERTTHEMSMIYVA